MVERISSGSTGRAVSTDAVGVSGKQANKGGGERANKGGLFSKRSAQKESVAQTRQSTRQSTHQSTKSVAGKSVTRSKVGSRANSRGDLPPTRPRAPTIESRETRRARLQETGKQLAQHKLDAAQAKDSHQRDVAQRLEQARTRSSGARDLTGKDTTGKDVAEVRWGTLDNHGMRNKLRQLDEVGGHIAAGRDYKILKPPALTERKAILREGHQGFASRLGSKIKDVLLRIFRPRQWQVRQADLAQARKDEFRAAELFSKNLSDMGRSKHLAAQNEASLVDERRAVNLSSVSDKSVEVAEVKPHIGGRGAYSIEQDEKIQQDPRYRAEKDVLDKGIAELRKEMEDEAKRHINEVLARQQARGRGEVVEEPASKAVKGQEIRGDGVGDAGTRRDTIKNPNETSL